MFVDTSESMKAGYGWFGNSSLIGDPDSKMRLIQCSRSSF
jgi:hypothetical protein